MSNRWAEIKAMVANKQLNGAPWKSDQKSLLEIFTLAEKMGIDPDDIAKSDLTKLRTIVKEARKAAEANDKERLTYLFQLTATQNIVDLRLIMATKELEPISVEEVEENGVPMYVIRVTKRQLERIQQSTKPFYRFDLNQDKPVH